MKNKYEVIKDTREQKGWLFEESDRCAGTTIQTLRTGDYTLKGMEDLLVIERKGSTGEFAININEDRFFRELERMDNFPFAFLILEFNMEDILSFPMNSGIPSKKWPRLRVSANFMLKKLIYIQNNFNHVNTILVGNRGEEVTTSIFKWAAESYFKAANA